MDYKDANNLADGEFDVEADESFLASFLQSDAALSKVKSKYSGLRDF